MAVVVENGTGLSTANSYVAVSYVDAYFSARGNDTWGDTDSAEKEAALIRATFSLDQKYRDLWLGVRKVSTQTLGWPRIPEKDELVKLLVDDEGYDIANNTVPREVMYAVSEVALIELDQRFFTQKVTRDDMVKREKIGPLDTEWFEGATSIDLFPHVDAILDMITTGAATQIEVYLTEEEATQTRGADGEIILLP